MKNPTLSNKMSALNSLMMAGLAITFGLFATPNEVRAQDQKPNEITKENFCKEFIDTKNGAYNGVTGESYKIGQVFTLLFNPKKMVEVKRLETPHQKMIKNGTVGEKMIFTLLPNPTLTDEENAQVDEFIRTAKEFNKLKSMLKIRVARKLTQESCLKILNKHNDEFPIIQKTIEVQNASASAIEKRKESNAFKRIPEFMKKFTDRGWTLSTATNYAEMFSTLQSNPKISEIMLILHEASEYDSNKKQMVSTQMLFDGAMNQLPKLAFSALPYNIDKVILMSCQADEVIKWYGIESAASHFDFYYAIPRERFKNQLMGRFPIIARDAFLDAADEPSFTRRKANRNCVVEIDSAVTLPVANVRLNGEFIGALSPGKTEINVDCSKLASNQNRVVVSYLGNPGVDKTSLQISAIRIISESGQVTNLNVQESFKISNPHEHYETVGK